MFEIVSDWLSPGFELHGHCLVCQRPLLWLYVASVSLVTFSYYMISIALVNFVSKRRDLAFNGVRIMFPAHFRLRHHATFGNMEALRVFR